MVTWEVILANLLAVLTNGGTAGMFWGYLIVVAGYVLVYLSLAMKGLFSSQQSACPIAFCSGCHILCKLACRNAQ